MTDSAGTVSIKPSKSLYFVSAPVDFFLIGGISILTFLILAALGFTERHPVAMQLAGVLVWFVNWPHFSATNYRLYHSKKNIDQYPMTAYLIPALILGAVAACFAAPELIAPYFIKFYLIWSPYHFSGQSVGISLVYARRGGVVFGKWERFALSGFIFGTFITQTAQAEVGTGRYSFYGIRYPGFGLPQEFASACAWWTYFCGAVFLVLMIRWSLRNRRLIPWVVLLPAFTQYVWFMLGWKVQSFYEFVPLFHSLQYLLIAWAMQLKERMDTEKIEPSKKYVLQESMRWGIANLFGGAVLFSFIPHSLAWVGVPFALANPVFIAAIQIHHFFVDGVIWKLKNPKVSSPLLVNFNDLLRKPVEASASG